MLGRWTQDSVSTCAHYYPPFWCGFRGILWSGRRDIQCYRIRRPFKSFLGYRLSFHDFIFSYSLTSTSILTRSLSLQAPPPCSQPMRTTLPLRHAPNVEQVLLLEWVHCGGGRIARPGWEHSGLREYSLSFSYLCNVLTMWRSGLTYKRWATSQGRGTLRQQTECGRTRKAYSLLFACFPATRCRFASIANATLGCSKIKRTRTNSGLQQRCTLIFRETNVTSSWAGWAGNDQAMYVHSPSLL